MSNILDIREVVLRTGLTSRALRFYEARGLIAPLRTYTGRRVYAAGDLQRLHQLVVLKAAGFTLAQIGRILAGKSIDHAHLIQAQLEALDTEAARLNEARAALEFALSRITAGEPVDAATFCSLIESGDRMMKHEPDAWKSVTDRYFTPQEKASFAEKMAEIPAEFNQADYAAKWKDLGDRIKAAMPMDPKSDAAVAFLDEWNVLLTPFTQVATPEMMAGATKLYDNMGDWQGEADPGFDIAVWEFIKTVSAARKA